MSQPKTVAVKVRVDRSNAWLTYELDGQPAKTVSAPTGTKADDLVEGLLERFQPAPGGRIEHDVTWASGAHGCGHMDILGA